MKTSHLLLVVCGIVLAALWNMADRWTGAAASLLVAAACLLWMDRRALKWVGERIRIRIHVLNAGERARDEMRSRIAAESRLFAEGAE